MMRGLVLSLACLVAGPARGCDTALLLAVDVSGSITEDEYQLQMQGLATALQTPEITQALVAGSVALSLMQWSGTGHQQMALAWQGMTSAADVDSFAAKARATARPPVFTDTAIGDAIAFSSEQFATVADCQHRVIDVSGDGVANDGLDLPAARAAAAAKGITINGIAIEDGSGSVRLSRYFRRFVISQGGFVITAYDLADYPRAIREKLARELSKAVS